MKKICIHVILFISLILIFWSTLVIGSYIPNERIYDNFVRSAENYRDKEPYTFHSGAKLNSIADNYADSILLNIAWNMGTGDLPFAASLNTRYYNGDNHGENIGLYLTVTENTAPNTDYTRYWHGNAGIVRILHLFTDVNGVRTIGFCTALLFIILTAIVLMKKQHTDIVIFLLISLSAVQVWNIRLSMEYQAVFIITFMLCPLFLILERKDDMYLILLSVASGTAVAFFDFLTTETLTLLLPLILVTAVRAKENRLYSTKPTLLLLLKCALGWGCTYAGAFILKWTAASIVSGENEFLLALSSAGERIGGEVTAAVKPNSFLSAISANLTVITGGTSRVEPGRIALFIIPILLVLFSLWYLLRTSKSNRAASVSLTLLVLPVFARYLILNNHSYMHEFFTYRALAAPILSLLLLVWSNIKLPKGKRVNRK